MTRLLALPACLAAVAILAAAPASANPALGGAQDIVDAEENVVHPTVATAYDAVDDRLNSITIRSPVDAEVEMGFECRPSSASPTGQECQGYVCMRTGGEGPFPVQVDPEGGVGVDLKALTHSAPYGPYTSVYVASDCGCNGWIGLQWVPA